MKLQTRFIVVLFAAFVGGLLWTGLPQAAVVVLVRSIRGEPIFDDAFLPRPENVPVDAVRIGHSKMQLWAWCRVEAGQNHCQVFNATGVVLEDEVFLPLDRGLPVPVAELQIDGSRSDSDTLELINGRVLVPARTYDRQKAMFAPTQKR